MIDLHMHTNFSDGIDSVNELIDKAKSKNIKLMSITDHNSIKAHTLLPKLPDDMLVITGVEFYGRLSTHGLHILGYNFDVNNKDLNDKMEFFKVKRNEAFLRKIELLKSEFNIFFDEEEIIDMLNNQEWLSNKQIEYLLSKKNYSASQIKEIVKSEKMKKIKPEKHMEPKECIELILGANGIPVLAHPQTLKKNDDELEMFIKELIGYGLMGIEVYNYRHQLEEIKKYLELAKKYNLLVSGGSDYHGIYGGTIEKSILGEIRGDIKEITILDYIKSKK